MESGMENAELSQRIRLARERCGMSLSDVARQLGVTHSAASQWEAGKTHPAANRLRQLSDIFSVSFDWLATAKGGPEPVHAEGKIVAEGQVIDISSIPSELRRQAETIIDGRDAEFYRLQTDNISGGPYRRGDIVVVDRQADQRPGAFVLAEHNKVPIFRLYYPPILYGLPLGAPIPHIVVDNIATFVRGVVVTRLG